MRDRYATILLIVLLAVMTCLPLLHSGYTTTDDVYSALGIEEGWRSPVLPDGTAHRPTWIYDARMSGRLPQAFTGLLVPMAYGYGSYWLAKTVGLTMILSNVAALFLVLRLLTGSARFGILAATFFFAFAPNTQDHNLLTAFPMIFSLAFTLLLLSVATWWLALEGRRRMTGLSVALLTISLFMYESFAPYAVVFPMLTLVATPGTWAARARRAVRTPHVPALVVFLLVVFGFREFFQLEAGRQMMAAEQYTPSLNPSAIWRVIEQYGAAALPLHYARVYRGLINDFYMGFGTYRVRLFEMFEVIEAAWIVKALIVAFLTATLALNRDRVRHRGTLWFLAFVFMVLTNLPLAITGKYQTWVAQGSRGYVTAYFAFFGVVILLGLIIEGTVALASRRSRPLSIVVAGIFTIATFLTSYGTDFINAHVALSQRQMYDKWRTADAWIASPFFRMLPEGSLILAPSLFEHYPGGPTVYDDYWSRYALQHGKKRVDIIHVPAEWYRRAQAPEAADKLYYLKVVQELRGDSSYLVVGQVIPGKGGTQLASNELALLLHAKSEHFRVVGRLLDVDSRCRARVFVDGVPSSGTFDEYFGAHVDKVLDPTEWRWARLSSERGLLAPESVIVSSSTESVDGPVDVVFDRGFYLDEVTHRWMDNTSTLILRNRADRAVHVDLVFEVKAPALDGTAVRHRLEATSGSRHQSWEVGALYEKRSMRVEIPALSSTEVTINTDAPKVVAPLDPRNMVLMLNATLRAQEIGCADTGTLTGTPPPATPPAAARASARGE